MSDITSIEFNNTGFWIPPSFVEVLSDYLCQTFENIGVNIFSQNLQKIYITCDLNRKGESIGMVSLPLDRYITNADDKATLINIFNQTRILINSVGEELGITALEDFENRKSDDYFKEPWAFPIKTVSLTATLDIIIQLLNGTWTFNSYSVYYTGFPNPMNMPEI
jgi:hypothetical protein